MFPEIFHFGLVFIFISTILLQVDSANKHGILLEVVQVLTDLNLIVTKAYISCDGCWFMDGKFLFLILTFIDSLPYQDFHLIFWLLGQFLMSLIKMETKLQMKGF